MTDFVKLMGPTGAYIKVKKLDDDSYGLADAAFREDIEHVHSEFEARDDDVIICAYYPRTRNPVSRIFGVGGTALVYVIRDPRAVAVSWFYHLSKMSPPANFNGTFFEFIYFFNNGLVPLGSWFHHIKLWLTFINYRKRTNPVHVIVYEDLIKDPMSEIQRLAQALGFSADKEHIKAIVKATRFDKLKEAKDELAETKLQPSFKRRWQRGKWDIFRKGEADDWKSHYTVRDNEQLLNLFHSEFTGVDFKLKSLL